MKRVISFIQASLNWLQLLTGAGLLTAVGWLAQASAKNTTWLADKGPAAWLLFGIMCALLVAGLLCIITWARYALVHAAALDKWTTNVDKINPLDIEFNRKRISISDLAHPVDKKIVGKRFIDCELVGPSAIIMVGNGHFSGVGFVNCDVVIAKQDSRLFNVTPLQDVTAIGGSIINCTIYINSTNVENFRQMGANFVSFDAPSAT